MKLTESSLYDTLSLAWRNVLRNRRRTLLTLAALAVAAVSTVWLGGYVMATLKGLTIITVREHGHFQLMSEGYLDFGRANPARFAIHDPQAVIQKLQSDPVLKDRIRVATPLLQIQGVAGHFATGQSSTFMGAGWEPTDRQTLLAWNGLGLNMPVGRTRLNAKQPEDGVIGVGLARLLGLCEALEIANCPKPPPLAEPTAAPEISADLAQLTQEAAAITQNAAGAASATEVIPVELLAANGSGAPNVVRMNVLRAEQQGVRDLDNMYVSLPISLAQRLVFGPQGQGATAIVIQLHQHDDRTGVEQRLQALIKDGTLPGLELRPFQDIAPAYNQIVGMFGTLFGFVAILMAIVTLFSVANTVNMAISERTGEIGTLRAIGVKRGQVLQMFVIEGGLMGFMGAALGSVFALLTAKYGINPAGFSWTPPGNATAVPVGIDVNGSLGLSLIIVGVLVVLACLSSWWPARRASKMEIVEALRHA